MRIRPELLIGVLLIMAAFVALYLVANLINPPAALILVARREIEPGERLTPELAQLVEAQLPEMDSFVLEAELEAFAGAVFIEAVHANQPIHKSNLVHADNPQALEHAALALDDPGMVAFVIPVSPETAPSDVRQGDRVDLTLGVGSASFASGQIAGPVTPAPNASGAVFGGQTDGEGEFQQPAPAPGEATQPAELTISLPVAKTLVRNARVLRVIYDQRPNPAFTGDVDQSAFLQGDIEALVIAIPLEAQEVITFALANGELRVAVRSPLAQEQDLSPSLGMNWEDLIAFFRAERDAGLAELDPAAGLSGSGASALWATQQANSALDQNDAPQLAPTPTATATAVPVEPSATPGG